MIIAKTPNALSLNNSLEFPAKAVTAIKVSKKFIVEIIINVN